MPCRIEEGKRINSTRTTTTETDSGISDSLKIEAKATSAVYPVPANDNGVSKSAPFTLTQEYLRSRFRYDPESGLFVRLRSGGGQKAGSVAGVVNDSGYVRIWIAGKHYRAHRLAFLDMNGEMPPAHIGVDHVNRCKTDNRWSNLRLASQLENLANTGPRSRNRTGFKGVNQPRNSKRFVARITIRGESRYLGTFHTAAEAGAAYQTAANDAYGEFAFQDQAVSRDKVGHPAYADRRDTLSAERCTYITQRRKITSKIAAERPDATQAEIGREVDRQMIRWAVAAMNDNVAFDLNIVLRFPLGSQVTPETVAKHLSEWRKRMMRRIYGPRWFKLIPEEGFTRMAVMEGHGQRHLHVLMVIDAAGARSKDQALSYFRKYADEIWRAVVRGGSAWVDDKRPTSDATRYMSKGLGTGDGLDRLVDF